jgi:hypothetical protein
MPRDARPVTFTLTRPAALVAVLFGVTMIALLTLNLVDIERQRRIAARQEGRAKLVQHAVPQVLGKARRAEPALVGGLTRADALVRRLRATGAAGAIAATGTLARDLERLNAPQAIAAAGSLAAHAQQADLVGDVQALRDVAGQLRDLSVQLRGRFDHSLAIQQQTLTILRRSLTIQEQTLAHARSIDRRLGGGVTPPPPAPPALR